MEGDQISISHDAGIGGRRGHIMRTSEGEYLLPRPLAGAVHNDRGGAVSALGGLLGRTFVVGDVGDRGSHTVHGRYGGYADGIGHDAHNDGRIVREAGGVQLVRFGRSEGSKGGLPQGRCRVGALLFTTSGSIIVASTRIGILPIHLVPAIGPGRRILGGIIVIDSIISGGIGIGIAAAATWPTCFGGQPVEIHPADAVSVIALAFAGIDIVRSSRKVRVERREQILDGGHGG